MLDLDNLRNKNIKKNTLELLHLNDGYNGDSRRYKYTSYLVGIAMFICSPSATAEGRYDNNKVEEGKNCV